MDTNHYYVYVWYRKDTNEPFYVGKGSGDRYISMRNRNKYFLNIVKSVETEVKIIHSNLSEEEAFDLETKIIADYRNKGYKLCNYTDGGDGGNTYKHLPENDLLKVRKKISKANFQRFKDPNERKKVACPGEKNGMYGQGHKLRGHKNGRAQDLVIEFPDGAKQIARTFGEAEKMIADKFQKPITGRLVRQIFDKTKSEGCYIARSHAKNKFAHLNGLKIYKKQR